MRRAQPTVARLDDGDASFALSAAPSTRLSGLRELLEAQRADVLVLPAAVSKPSSACAKPSHRKAPSSARESSSRRDPIDALQREIQRTFEEVQEGDRAAPVVDVPMSTKASSSSLTARRGTEGSPAHSSASAHQRAQSLRSAPPEKSHAVDARQALFDKMIPREIKEGDDVVAPLLAAADDDRFVTSGGRHRSGPLHARADGAAWVSWRPVITGADVAARQISQEGRTATRDQSASSAAAPAAVETATALSRRKRPPSAPRAKAVSTPSQDARRRPDAADRSHEPTVVATVVEGMPIANPAAAVREQHPTDRRPAAAAALSSRGQAAPPSMPSEPPPEWMSAAIAAAVLGPISWREWTARQPPPEGRPSTLAPKRPASGRRKRPGPAGCNTGGRDGRCAVSCLLFELWVTVSGFLDWRSLVRLAKVSVPLRRVACSSTVWAPIAARACCADVLYDKARLLERLQVLREQDGGLKGAVLGMIKLRVDEAEALLRHEQQRFDSATQRLQRRIDNVPPFAAAANVEMESTVPRMRELIASTELLVQQVERDLGELEKGKLALNRAATEARMVIGQMASEDKATKARLDTVTTVFNTAAKLHALERGIARVVLNDPSLSVILRRGVDSLAGVETLLLHLPAHSVPAQRAAAVKRILPYDDEDYLVVREQLLSPVIPTVIAEADRATSGPSHRTGSAQLRGAPLSRRDSLKRLVLSLCDDCGGSESKLRDFFKL